MGPPRNTQRRWAQQSIKRYTRGFVLGASPDARGSEPEAAAGAGKAEREDLVMCAPRTGPRGRPPRRALRVECQCVTRLWA
jgi:hypothetical protein